MPAGARYYMPCFSDLELGDWGPCRIREDEIRRNFVDGWLVEAIEASRIEITIGKRSRLARVDRTNLTDFYFVVPSAACSRLATRARGLQPWSSG